jgi:hypothetical protein
LGSLSPALLAILSAPSLLTIPSPLARANRCEREPDPGAGEGSGVRVKRMTPAQSQRHVRIHFPTVAPNLQ